MINELKTKYNIISKEMSYNEYLKSKNYDLYLKKDKIIIIHQIINQHHDQHLEFIEINNQINELFFGKYAFTIENNKILDQYELNDFIEMILQDKVFIYRRLNHDMICESEDVCFDLDEFASLKQDLKLLRKKLFAKKKYYELYSFNEYDLISK